MFDINPCELRADIDAQRWAEAGELPKKPQPFGSSAWKMDPDRDRSVLHFHVAKGYSTPENVTEVNKAIALRNARELAEHLGNNSICEGDEVRHRACDEPWPSYGGTSYVPVPCHTNPDRMSYRINYCLWPRPGRKHL